MNDGCSLTNVVAFIHAHQHDAATLGAALRVPLTYILRLSGWESTWGANRFAREGNNFFSLHGDERKPFATGVMRAAGGRRPLMSKFPSYLACGQSFIAQYGAHLYGTASPAAFAQGLIKSGFNSGSAKTGGNDDFADNTVTAIAMVERRRAC
jgi:hypothetical protein